jgi:hypothetical protein
VFDDACSARRGGIELQLLVDRLLRRPHKRRQPADLAEREAAERRTVRTVPTPLEVGAWEPLPASVGLVGPLLDAVAGELAIRGVSVCGADPLPAIAEALRRGRVTPLEADQARKRLTEADPHAADWTVSTAGPVRSRPGRLVALPSSAVPAWLRRAGVIPVPGAATARGRGVLPSPFGGEGAVTAPGR